MTVWCIAMKAAPVRSKKVMVTGCSSGIGLAAARLLRDRGWMVVPTARQPQDLDRLRQEGFTPVRLDVADGASVRAAADEALRVLDGEIGALVNNAGFGQPGAMEDLTRDEMRYQFEVNVFGLQELTNLFVPAFRKQGYGRIVNVSSVLGRTTIPLMGIYAGSKYAVEAMSDAMRMELRGSSVAVSIVEPGPIATKFTDRSTERGRALLSRLSSSIFAEAIRRKMDGSDGERKISRLFTVGPEAVAVRILHAVESPRPRRRYPVTPVAYFLAFMRRFAPDAFMDWALSKRIG